MLEHGIFTTRVTHGGRHADSIEAWDLELPIDVIKRGNWKDTLGRLEPHYLGKLPSQFARGMAGFWNKPSALSRNQVKPSPELQRPLFLWIENTYGEGSIAWKQACLKEMEEVDENEDDGGNDYVRSQ